MRLKIKKLTPDAQLPAYAKPGDAGLDLFANARVVLKPGARASIPTGIAIQLPRGYVALVWDKSGLSHQFGLKTLGGVVDAGYRGEIKVGIINLSRQTYVFERHHKVAQLLVQRVESVTVERVKELTRSTRGTAGFGSSGK